MNDEQLRLLAITMVAIVLGMLATVILPVGFKVIGLLVTIITVMVLLTRR